MTELVDQEARDRIRGSLDESLIVEAAAGTGKTTELIHRIAHVLAEGRAEVGQIVAVTFTRKAAGELKLRLRQTLDVERQRATDDQRRQNLDRAVAQLEEARVGTIHSFCAEILRERPVEAGVDPGFEELTEEAAPRLFRQVSRSFIQEQLKDLKPGLARVFSRSSLGPWDDRAPTEKLMDAAWNLADWRDFPTPWRREPFDREGAIGNLMNEVCALGEMAERAQNPYDPLARSLSPCVQLKRHLEREGELQPNVSEGLLVSLASDLGRNLKKGRGNYADGLARAEVLDARDQLLLHLEPFVQKTNADLAAQVRDELWELVSRYDAQKRKTGVLDFLDLLVRARDLLRDNGEVRRFFQRRYSHIFVDEFQDTDPLQTEILLLLAARDPDESNWEKARPLPGKLFLVGDPKQSIYRFRRADVVLYQRVKQVLCRPGPDTTQLLHLTHSFRALAPIQDALNRAFEPEMVLDEQSGQPGYVPLRAGPIAFQQPAIVALPVPKPYGRKNVAKYAIECSLPSAAAAFVEWLVKKSGWRVRDPHDPERRIAIRPEHIALLFRRIVAFRHDVTARYLRSLEARGIPHIMVGSRSFQDREEIETLRAALMAIEWPDDELAVFAALKGPLFAISDEVLLRFRHQHKTLHPFVDAQGDEPRFRRLQAALSLLAELHLSRNQRPIVDTINALLAATRAHASFALRPAGNQVLANVQRVCDLARSFEISGGLSFRGFVMDLNEQAERERTPEAPLLEEGTRGVRVMTVHAAKGLEFPVVILADLTKNLAGRSPTRTVDSKTGIAATRLLGCAPLELLEQEKIEQVRDEAEGVRICYVAATRARDLLVVPALGGGPIPKEGAYSWSSWLTPLNKVIYPEVAAWRKPKEALGCPPFGEWTILAGPDSLEMPLCLKPGRHQGGVVWWDPDVLPLDEPAMFGLRQEEFLAKDSSGKVAAKSIEDYADWQRERAQDVEQGEINSILPLRASAALVSPPDFKAEITDLRLPRAADRPGGLRFGSLVHTILKEVDFAAVAVGERSQEQEAVVHGLASLHGRVLGAPKEEIDAAVPAVLVVLGHDLIQRAAGAERSYRELPILFETDDGQTLDGAIDLAFVEHGAWIVVDFKTDADPDGRHDQYKRQMEWYLYAISRLTGSPARGILCTL